VIPGAISREHVLAALSRIERERVPPERENRSVVLEHNGKGYPPKYVISVATEIATGRSLPASAFITTDAERHLLRLGFSVVRIGQQMTRHTEGREHPALAPIGTDFSPQKLRGMEQELLHSRRLYRWSEIRNSPGLPPKSPGVYAWFFDRIPPDVPTDACLLRDGASLLYVGISPHNDRSKGTLRDRLRFHFEGNAESSTLRMTLGCLLESELGTILRRVGSGKTETFVERESALSKWMADYARVAWIETVEPWILEEHLLKSLSLPLNIQGNARHPFCARLKELRQKAKRRAEELEILPGRKTLFLVSCVSEKQDRPMPARELYCSQWFQKARAFVERQGRDWFILSAKYGLVAPDQVIEPYNETLSEKTVAERREWSNKVIQELRTRCTPGTSVVILAGEKYREFLLPALLDLGCNVEVPMTGLARGPQLRWLSERG
jgi:hypothetical protein